MKTVNVVDLRPEDEETIQQIAHILVAAFQKHYPNAWSTLEDALEEIHDSFSDDMPRISRVALDENGRALGWVGGIAKYEYAWELHPLAVDPAFQGQGIGRALVADLEEQVRARGGLTIYLGTDDEDNQTSLATADLFPNPWPHIAAIQNINRHPFEFYQKCGYVIIGVLPDANGPGKPDILMAKRVSHGQ